MIFIHNATEIYVNGPEKWKKLWKQEGIIEV